MYCSNPSEVVLSSIFERNLNSNSFLEAPSFLGWTGGSAFFCSSDCLVGEIVFRLGLDFGGAGLGSPGFWGLMKSPLKICSSFS